MGESKYLFREVTKMVRKVPRLSAEGLFFRPIPSAQNGLWRPSAAEGLHHFFRPSAFNQHKADSVGIPAKGV